MQCYELLIEFFKEQGGKYVFARIGEKVVIVYKHILGEVFKISAKRWKEQKDVDKEITKNYVETNCIA